MIPQHFDLLCGGCNLNSSNMQQHQGAFLASSSATAVSLGWSGTCVALDYTNHCFQYEAVKIGWRVLQYSVPMCPINLHILIHFAIPYGLATDEIILRDATCVHEGIGISTSIAATMVGGSKASSGEHTKNAVLFWGSFAMTHDCSLRK